MRRSRSARAALAVLGAFVVMDAAASAQSTPLATLPEEAPATVLYRVGPVLVNPKLTVPEIGRDSNAFNESTAPREDFVIKLTPEIDFYTDVGVLRVVAKSATALTYYHRFDSERSIAEQVRGRVTARFSRVRPWVGGASVRSNERTTEIDARARRQEREVAAGLQFEVSPLASVMVSASRVQVAFSPSAEYLGTNLSDSLNRTSETVGASLRMEATPLTTVTFHAYGGRDAFTFDRERDAETRGGEVEVSFGPEAIVRGRVALGFRQVDFDDPAIATFRGLSGRGGMTTLLVWRAMLGIDYVRELQYSFDRSEGYYLENGADLVYTQRLGGPFDVQVRVGRHALEYGARTTATTRAETLQSYQGGVGYSLESGSRFGVSYEFAERTGGTTADRAFSRQRIFGTFTYEFWK